MHISFASRQPFNLIISLHKIQQMADSSLGGKCYPFLALCNLEGLPSLHQSSQWAQLLLEVQLLLEGASILIDRLPSYSVSLNAPLHLLPPKEEINATFKGNICRSFTHIFWTRLFGPLHHELAFLLHTLPPNYQRVDHSTMLPSVLSTTWASLSSLLELSVFKPVQC